MSRHFTAASGEFVDFSPGAIVSNDGGPLSIAVLWRPASNHDGTLVQARNAGNFETWAALPISDGNIWHSVGGSSRAVHPWLPAGGWRIDGISKPGGASQTVRGHYALLGGAWTHVDSTTCDDTANIPIDIIRVGNNNVASLPLDGDVAAIACCSAVWSDATFETLAAGLLAWDSAIGSDPAALWAFNQTDIGTPVEDLTGGSADQSGVSGTSIGEDPPGWSYALAEPVTVTGAGTLPTLTATAVADVTPTGVAGAATLPAPTSTALVEVGNPTTAAAAASFPTPVGTAVVTAVNPTLWPNSELVAVAWIGSAAGLSGLAATRLPRDTSAWSASGFLTIAAAQGTGGVVGGAPDKHTQLRNPVVSVHAWAVNPASGKPPFGKAAHLLELLQAACNDETTIRRQLTLPSGYRSVRVNEAYLLGEPKRLPGDDGSYAHFQADLQLHWVVLS
jgi:hypothetical protein